MRHFQILPFELIFISAILQQDNFLKSKDDVKWMNMKNWAFHLTCFEVTSVCFQTGRFRGIAYGHKRNVGPVSDVLCCFIFLTCLSPNWKVISLPKLGSKHLEQIKIFLFWNGRFPNMATYKLMFWYFRFISYTFYNVIHRYHFMESKFD